MKGPLVVLRRIITVFEYFSCLLLCICTLSAFINVVTRYVLSKPISWSEELSVLTLIWIVYLSQSQMEFYNEQLSMTAIYRFMSDRIKKVVNLVRSIITILLSSYLFYAGLNVVKRNYSLKVYTQVLDFPYWIAYLVIPLTFAFIALIRLTNPLVVSSCGILEKGDENKCCGE